MTMKMINSGKAFMTWLRPMTRKEYKKQHGYDPALPSSTKANVRDRFTEVTRMK